ncbi:MAG: response regulator [Chloroflexi bacterium]|nr:response regulator [Chloroflexota bacterium]
MSSLLRRAGGMSEKQILLVDDEPSLLEIFGTMLKRQGFTVWKATNALDALDLMRNIKPDLFILDVMMPGMNGIELCRELRTWPDTHTTPVMMLSALGDSHTQRASLDAGADLYLQKPILPRELVSRVQELVGELMPH